MITGEGKKQQHENKITLEALPEINEDSIIDDLLETFVSEEFRTLSYHIVKNKLFDVKAGEDDHEYRQSPSPSASPSISQEDEAFRLDQY